MRFIILSWCGVCVSAALVTAGEPKSESRGAWIAIPGERELMRVENPPDGLVSRNRASLPATGMERVTKSVNRELHDVARALRSLDQSYAIRGFQGCGASTAGSVFIDWRTKGLRQPEGTVVLPPAPIVLGIPKTHHCCPRCRTPLIEEEMPCDCDDRAEPTPLPLVPTPTLP